ncbi:MAG: hypothetical protein IPI66_07435 [Chitinophagaceae bacterium]|nr:hypothetical protein [Chitinophagaceae bacterium]
MKLNLSVFKMILLAFLFPAVMLIGPLKGIAQKNRVYDLVKDFKARPDDKTDNYAAFKMAAETISKAGGGTLNIPRGRYYIAAYKGMRAPGNPAVYDISFMNCKNLELIGNQSVIRVNGNFSRDRDYQLGGLPYHYAYKNTVCPIRLVNCKRVTIRDITLYGEVDKMRRQEGVVEGENYGIYIDDEKAGDTSRQIVLNNVTAHHFAADGILIKSNGGDILINRCRAYNNARQGLSIVKGINISCIQSSFDSTGFTGAYGWHMPGAGIDVENEFGAGKLKDVLIRNCAMRGNKGFQLVTTLPSENVRVDSCFISDVTAGYSDAMNGVGLYSLRSTLSNCILFAGIQVDLADQGYKGPEVQVIKNNLLYSGNRFIVSSDFSRPVNITDNILVMLPKPLLDVYSPYIQNPNCRFNRNIIVLHADRVKKEANQVTALVQNAKEAVDDIWLMNGYDIPLSKQSSVFYVPAFNGTPVVKNNFFQRAGVMERMNIPEKNLLSVSQVSQLLSNKLFTAYKQTAYDPQMLREAEWVRTIGRKFTEAGK